MFNNDRYVTAGVCNTLPPWLVLLIWQLIDSLNSPADYLQVFSVSYSEEPTPHITIVHSQEQPEYTAVYEVNTTEKINAKIFVIDDTTHSTMLLAEEY